MSFAGDCVMLVACAAVMVLAATPPRALPARGAGARSDLIDLPAPKISGGMTLAETVRLRRSHRAFLPDRVSSTQLAQLCWAAQGITDPEAELRAAPSAGALYPMTLFAVDATGVFEYRPQEHALRCVRDGDVRVELQQAALDQACVGDAPLCLVITMSVGRSARKYGDRAERYCLMEAGHIAQNILLQATALGLDGVPVGAFDEADARRVLGLPRRMEPVYLVPLGRAERD